MRKIYFTIILVIGGLFIAQNVFALTISPPVIELGGNPGQEVRSAVKLFNETSSDITVWTSAADFGAKKGEEGEPIFYTLVEKEKDLSGWIEINPGPITIPSLSWQSVPFTIKIPDSADPGGHYAAIFFGSQPPGETGAIGLASKIGTLVLLRVSGDINEKGKLLEFSLKDGRRFYDSLPVKFEIRFQNSGNVHLKPEGEIEIKDMVGRTEGIVEVNKVEAGGNVLPNSVRKYEATWQKKEYKKIPSGFIGKLRMEKNNFALGKYRANLNLEYGAQAKKASAVLYFWVFPWHLILVSLIGFIVLIFLLYFGVKRYNRWIIKRALREREILEKRK